MKNILLDYKEKGISFEYFVLSGNGEPSLYEYDFLKQIVEIVEDSQIFKNTRIQTSGNLFFDEKKWRLFENWLIEITRVDLDFNKDKKILGYKRDYLSTTLFEKSKIRLNHVLLKNNFETLNSDIKKYISIYDNIEVVALKILDTLKDNPHSKQNIWIKENGLRYNEIDNILNKLKSEFSYEDYVYNNYIFKYNQKTISIYYILHKEKRQNILFYGNKIFKNI